MTVLQCLRCDETDDEENNNVRSFKSKNVQGWLGSGGKGVVLLDNLNVTQIKVRWTNQGNDAKN